MFSVCKAPKLQSVTGTKHNPKSGIKCVHDTSPGAVAVGGDEAETQAVCCVPPRCACGSPVGLCVVVAAWLQLKDLPHRGGRRGPPSPRGFL